jgi:hypothetical protein
VRVKRSNRPGMAVVNPPPRRGMALVSVLLATALLLALVTILVDLGTLQLQRATAELRAVQALAGADAGTAWVRAVLDQERGDVPATLAKLAVLRGRRRIPIDSRTYVVASVALMPASGGQQGDHTDDNVQQADNSEQIVQIESSAALYVDGAVATHRATTTLVRVFPAAPYSEIVGMVDAAGPVGIQSPGDAAGQAAAANATELLVHVFAMQPGLTRPKNVDDFSKTTWDDGNSIGPGPLP